MTKLSLRERRCSRWRYSSSCFRQGRAVFLQQRGCTRGGVRAGLKQKHLASPTASSGMVPIRSCKGVGWSNQALIVGAVSVKAMSSTFAVVSDTFTRRERPVSVACVSCMSCGIGKRAQTELHFAENSPLSSAEFSGAGSGNGLSLPRSSLGDAIASSTWVNKQVVWLCVYCCLADSCSSKKLCSYQAT